MFAFQFLAFIFWALAICVGVLLVYIPYTKFVDGLEPWTTTQMAVYEALGRPVWALCVAWVVYACTTNLGGKYLFGDIQLVSLADLLNT